MSTERREGDEAEERAAMARDPVLAKLGLSVEPVKPSTGALDRLLRTVSLTSRFERFARLVADALGVTSDLGQRLLDGIDRVVSWADSPWPGVRLYHLEGPLGEAPIVAQAVVGFVRVAPGVTFPTHRHLGDETVVVVQGGLVDDDGTVARPGDVIVRAAGSEHAFTASPGPDLVYLAVIRDGVAFGEIIMRPGSEDV